MAHSSTPAKQRRVAARKPKKQTATTIKPAKVSQKKLVQQDLFEACQKRGKFVFDNKLVKKMAEKNGFGNPYDATKVDSRSTMAPNVLNRGYCIAHLGKGNHKFIKAARQWFHDFEEIEATTIEWPYRKSALNETDTSESNILSVGFNQRIIHDFLYQDIVASPKM